MRCGLHYVRFCDFRIKQCVGAPGSRAATKSVADAMAGGPLTRRKVHAFARHPSGSRPGAPGVRLPSDRLVLDPRAPRPPGPAIPRAQVGAPVDLGGGPSAPARVEQHISPVPQDFVGPEETGLAYTAQDGAHSVPRPGAIGALPSGLQVEEELGEARATARGSRGIRAFLGLGPGETPPDNRPGVVKAGRAGKPAKAKTKRGPTGPTSQRARNSSSARASSGNPTGHIQHWLSRTSVGTAATLVGAHGAPGCSDDPAPGTCQDNDRRAPEVQEASWLSPGAPGNSIGSPPGGRRPGSSGPSLFVPESQGTSHRGPGGARRTAPVSSCESRDHRTGGGWSPSRGVGFGPGFGTGREAEGTTPRACATSRIFCAFPRGRRTTGTYLPCLARGARGSWSMTRPPAAQGAANFRTVATLKRGPSLSLSLSLSPSLSLSLSLSLCAKPGLSASRPNPCGEGRLRG